MQLLIELTYTIDQKFGVSKIFLLIILFSKDTLKWSKVRVKTLNPESLLKTTKYYYYY